MNGWTNEWMNKWMNEWMNKWMDECTDMFVDYTKWMPKQISSYIQTISLVGGIKKGLNLLANL